MTANSEPQTACDDQPLVARLRAAGVTGRVLIFAEPVPTAAAAAEALGCPVGAIANSLVFDADGRPLLVLASGAARVDPKLLAAGSGVRKVRRATADFVAQHTGQQVGGVAPVGHPQRLTTMVDNELADHPEIWAGGGDEFTMFATTFAELLEISGGSAADVR